MVILGGPFRKGPDHEANSAANLELQRAERLYPQVMEIFQGETRCRYAATKPQPSKKGADVWRLTRELVRWFPAEPIKWAPPIKLGKVQSALNLLSGELPSVIEQLKQRGNIVLRRRYSALLDAVHAAGGNPEVAGHPKSKPPQIIAPTRRYIRFVHARVETLLRNAGWEKIGIGNYSPAIRITQQLLGLFDVKCTEERVRKALRDIAKANARSGRAPRQEYWLDRIVQDREHKS